jgi:transposase-like protein
VLKSTLDEISVPHNPVDFERTRSGKLVAVDARIDTTLTVSEAAARFGLTAHTLRWYEQVGLVDPVLARVAELQADLDVIDKKIAAYGSPDLGESGTIIGA